MSQPSAELRAALSREVALVCDPGGLVLWRDLAAQRLLGLEPGSRLADVVSLGSGEKAAALVADALVGPVEERELLLDVDGLAASCAFRGAPTDGGVLLVGSLRPQTEAAGMTELTALVDELAVLQRETERQRRSIAGLHQAEREARQLAERAVQVRDFTLSSVSHDLKTPLTAIKGTAQVLRRLVARGHVDLTQLETKLEHIATIATTMDAMIEQILDIARLQMGEPLRLKRSSTDLVALAEERVELIRGATGRHPIALLVEDGTAALVGSWDRSRLTRVVDNLLTNAVKYSPPGQEITVRLSREAGADGDDAVLRVEDHGIGIPAEDMEAIFAPFRRAGNVAPIDGMGMGLASAQRIVELHGGQIEVVSEVGRGTTFTIRLPLVAPQGAA